jgi:AcrR family transcriptional regulator
MTVGSKQRRERERRELRQAILTAARDIAAREGWQAVTIRKVAEAIEYTPPMIYEYFASKEALLYELLCEGFRQVGHNIRAIQTKGGPPENVLVQVVLAYWRFAFTSPELYQVMHGLGGVPFGTSETPPEAQSAFAAVREVVDAVMSAHGVQRPDLDGDVDILWSTLHGLISLTMTGRIAGGEPRAATLVERAVQDLLRAWGAEEREAFASRHQLLNKTSS